MLKATQPPNLCVDRMAKCKANAPPCEKPAITILDEETPASNSFWTISLMRAAELSNPPRSSRSDLFKPNISLHPDEKQK